MRMNNNCPLLFIWRQVRGECLSEVSSELISSQYTVGVYVFITFHMWWNIICRVASINVDISKKNKKKRWKGRIIIWTSSWGVSLFHVEATSVCGSDSRAVHLLNILRKAWKTKHKAENCVHTSYSFNYLWIPRGGVDPQVRKLCVEAEWTVWRQLRGACGVLVVQSRLRRKSTFERNKCALCWTTFLLSSCSLQASFLK